MRTSTKFHGIADGNTAGNYNTSSSDIRLPDDLEQDEDIRLDEDLEQDEDPPKTAEQIFAEQFLQGITPEEVDAEEYPWKEEGDMITMSIDDYSRIYSQKFI
jgi:hypothetical protein